jgi:hypothetical protein
MLTYNIQFEKSEQRVQNPITKKWSWVMVPQYTQEQLDLLGAAVEAALGEDFISFEVEDQLAQQMTTVTYNGIIVDDVEEHRLELLDGVYQTWYLEQLGA